MMSARDRPADHRLMAEVESVEVAKRDDAAAQVLGNAGFQAEPLHDLPSSRLDSQRREPYLPLIPTIRFSAAHSCDRPFFV
jgi:hypothetical protein